MDPITSVSLASAVIQLTDFGLKAIRNTHELYTKGSLQDHEAAERNSQHLSTACAKLEGDLKSASAPLTDDDRTVLDVSVACSETSKQLLKELQKYKPETLGKFRQAFRKGLRAFRAENLNAIEAKLQKYQQTLNTVMIIRLDQRVAEQQNEAARVKQLKAWQRSLRFEGMFDRANHVPEAFPGTCGWIFVGKSPVWSSEASLDLDLESDANTNNQSRLWSAFTQQYREYGSNRKRSDSGWNSFVQWLQGDEKLYFVSGKFGSGKSTIMRFIAQHANTKAILKTWADEHDIIILQSFFWKPGKALEKSIEGMLRTLLYQILAVRGTSFLEIVTVGENNNQNLSQKQEQYYVSCNELQKLLFGYLETTRRTDRYCILVDGLDECLEEEHERLLDLIEKLSKIPTVKVCVSSRPERPFVNRLKTCPSLRMHDLNGNDIARTVVGRLLPELIDHLPDVGHHELFEFTRGVMARAEGVFQWLDVVLQDLIRSVKDGENFNALHRRLDAIPDTIEGLYSHMLSRLDKFNRMESQEYFALLLASKNSLDPLPWTIMDYAFAKLGSEAWERVLLDDYDYFQTSAFLLLCDRIETRILVCCAGLVSVYTRSVGSFDQVAWVRRPGIYPHELVASSVSSCLRQVDFTHRSVAEFLESQGWCSSNNEEELYQTRLRVSQGRLGSTYLAPLFYNINEYRPLTLQIVIRQVSSDIQGQMPKDAHGYVTNERLSTATLDHMILVDKVLTIIHRRINLINSPWYNFEEWISSNFRPWEDSLLLGLHDIWAYSGLSLVFPQPFPCNINRDHLSDLLRLSVMGYVDTYTTLHPSACGCMRNMIYLLEQGADPNVPLVQWTDVNKSHNYDIEPSWQIASHMTAWSCFVKDVSSELFEDRIERSRSSSIEFEKLTRCKSILKRALAAFLHAGADLSASIIRSDGEERTIIIEETLLSNVLLRSNAAPRRAATHSTEPEPMAVAQWLETFHTMLRSRGAVEGTLVRALAYDDDKVVPSDTQSLSDQTEYDVLRVVPLAEGLQLGGLISSGHLEEIYNWEKKGSGEILEQGKEHAFYPLLGTTNINTQ